MVTRSGRRAPGGYAPAGTRRLHGAVVARWLRGGLTIWMAKIHVCDRRTAAGSVLLSPSCGVTGMASSAASSLALSHLALAGEAGSRAHISGARRMAGAACRTKSHRQPDQPPAPSHLSMIIPPLTLPKMAPAAPPVKKMATACPVCLPGNHRER